ncbi:MAG TPA: patatin-like phospholipase family protein [Gammaproteobacteria bacterium]|nr:patatin-like phospholipase family protein [Gammaproteobacteria bacterium]
MKARRWRIVLLCLLVSIGVPLAQAAQPPAAAAIHKRPKICLVLSGGGARGAAHVGVLEVLESLHVPISCIVGTSMGAIIGGLYASGMPPEFLQAVLEDPQVQRAMAENRPRQMLAYRTKERQADYIVSLEFGYENGRFYFPRGLVRGHSARELLNALTLRTRPARNFSDLPIPFRAIASDIETGEMVVLDHGDLAEAMRASMAVPGFYAPVQMQGHLLVDGGLVRNLPVDVARQMGADIIIAVDVSTPLANAKALGNVLGLSVQVINLLTRQNVTQSLAELGPHDVIIQPHLDGMTAVDFDLMTQAIKAGRAAAVRMRKALEPLAVPEPVWQQYLMKQRHMPAMPQRLAFIDIEGNSRVPKALIRSQIRTRVGRPFHFTELKRDVRRLYELGEFERVDARIVRHDGKPGVVIRVKEKNWQPNYLEFGMNIEDDFEGDSFYNMRFGYRKPAVNHLGGEWDSALQVGRTRRVFTGLYQPLGYGSPFFVEPSAEYLNHTFYTFTGATRDAEFNVRTLQAALDIGREIGDLGEIRFGLARGKFDTTPHVGDSILPAAHDGFGAYEFRFAFDTLNNYNFPSEGVYANLYTFSARPGLGGRLNYDKVSLTAGAAFSIGDNNFLINTDIGTSLGTQVPFYDQFTLGGFLSLSGLRQDELRGNEAFATHLIYYNRVGTLPGVLGNGVYIGGSLEAGNVWQDRGHDYFSGLRYGASLFVGADTAIGALYLGTGLSQNNQAAFYLYLGRPF